MYVTFLRGGGNWFQKNKMGKCNPRSSNGILLSRCCPKSSLPEVDNGSWTRPDQLLTHEQLQVEIAGVFWRHIWRVAGRESGSPELLESPRKFPKLPRKFFGDFPGSSLAVELNSNPGVPRKFPSLPRKFPGLPRKSPRTSPQVRPFLWEAWRPLLTHKNFLWVFL